MNNIDLRNLFQQNLVVQYVKKQLKILWNVLGVVYYTVNLVSSYFNPNQSNKII